ncbi:MAG: pilus assembly protein TadG-related protein [Roseobacter sp.]
MYTSKHDRKLKIAAQTRLFSKKFKDGEEGTITIFACFLVLMMLMICGIAVDLMQNEMTRTKVQNTLDRAVLAASDLDQPLPPDDVVDDYFLKAGMAEFLNEVEITPGAQLPATNFRIVQASAQTRTRSPYMAMTGVFELPVYSIGTAEETIENTEISLVIDISGSMRNSGKIGNLRTAAKEFIGAVLQGNAANTTSLSIIPYAGQVNPGRVMFDFAGGQPFGSFYINEEGETVPFGQVLRDEEGEPAVDQDGNLVWVPYNEMSSCLEIEPSDFNNINLPSGGYPQTPYFMYWPIHAPTMDWGWCPQNKSAIRYAQNDIGSLQEFIDDIRLHDGTGTHYGMKYGVALLNPSSNSAFIELNKNGLVPDQFKDRPASFEDDDTRKVIVLMTDGQITDQYRPIVAVDPQNETDDLKGRSGDRTTPTKRSKNLEGFYSMCDKAKDENIQIYTIAFEAPSNAVTEMRNCATAPAYFYNVKGVEISSAFRSIARQINQLRLTQ